LFSLLAEQLDRNIKALIETRDDPKAAPAMRERAARTLLEGLSKTERG